jgi:hypothetical protein
MPNIKIMLKKINDLRFRLGVCFTILSSNKFLVVTSNNIGKLKTIDIESFDIAPADEIIIADTIKSNSIFCDANLKHCNYVDQILTQLIYN